MDLLTTAREQLPWLLVLVLPGFISIRVFELLVPTRSTSTGREALEALSYGAINFGIWAVPVLYWLPWLKVRPLRFTLVAILLLIVSPAALALGARAVLVWPYLRKWVVHPVPTAWDHFFGLRQAAWMRIHLKNGRFIGGWYGDGSFAGSDPEWRDLYVEQALREGYQPSTEQRGYKPAATQPGPPPTSNTAVVTPAASGPTVAVTPASSSSQD